MSTPEIVTELRDGTALLEGATEKRDGSALRDSATELRDGSALRDGATMRDGNALRGDAGGGTVNRRAALKVLAAAPFATSLLFTEPEIDLAAQRAEAVLLSGAVYEPRFFTPAEWKTVRVLSDLIIPRDARSGSATDVGVPEFIDFMMIDQTNRQAPMRKGLTWLDAATQTRYGRTFVESDTAQQAALLDELAWPKKAPAALKDGVDFFVSFRNYVLTGFFSSKVGVEDLQYIGNTFVPDWNGCPPAAMSKLGVSYDE